METKNKRFEIKIRFSELLNKTFYGVEGLNGFGEFETEEEANKKADELYKIYVKNKSK